MKHFLVCLQPFCSFFGKCLTFWKNKNIIKSTNSERHGFITISNVRTDPNLNFLLLFNKMKITIHNNDGSILYEIIGVKPNQLSSELIAIGESVEEEGYCEDCGISFHLKKNGTIDGYCEDCIKNDN